jgi:hypothetical protein
MKKLIAFIILICVFFIAPGAWASEKPSLNIPVKTLYSAPHEDSNPIYDIPIEVKLLDISDDGNWYKAKIAYSLGPFSYAYVGWIHVPIIEILAERETSEIASLSDTN